MVNPLQIALTKKTILFDLVGLLSGCLISVLKRVNRPNITTRIQDYTSLLFHVIKTIRLAYTYLESLHTETYSKIIIQYSQYSKSY